MIHFAYPNVKASRFIGCGRYAVFSSDKLPEGYEMADPRPVKISQIMESALILAPESSVIGDPDEFPKLSGSISKSSRIIYEKKDESDEKYFGDSLDFAYLLALIHRSRPVRLNISSDIWCTGCIDLHQENPILEPVMPAGFDAKLDAFLSQENKDILFIVHNANLTPIHYTLIKEKAVRVLSLKQFQKAMRGTLINKTIVTIRRNELKALRNVLFENPYKPKKFRALLWCIVVSVVIGTGLSYEKQNMCDLLSALSPQLADNRFCNVSFDDVVEKLKELGEKNEATFLHLWITPLEAKIGDTSISYHFQSMKDCYVTVISITTRGDLIQLFPNKLQPSQFVEAKKKYTILDHPEFKLRVTGPPGNEEVMAFVSESPFVLFSEKFKKSFLFQINQEDQILLNKIAQNIRKAKKLNIAQRLISYTVIGKTD